MAQPNETITNAENTSPPAFDTRTWVVSPTAPADELESSLSEAARMLQAGLLVAFPTETVYGLAANARSHTALQGIYRAKGRPSDNPLIVHVASIDEFLALGRNIPQTAIRLARHFWPGPLTIIIPTAYGPEAACETARAGLDCVGVRMPSHPVALALLRACGLPLAAPSANLSGRPSPTTAKHVSFDLGGRISGLVDGGPSDGVGLESTVVEATDDADGGGRIVILRPGGVTREQLEEIVGVGRVTLDPSIVMKTPTPTNGPSADTAASTLSTSTSPLPHPQLTILPKQNSARAAELASIERLTAGTSAGASSDAASSPSPSPSPSPSSTTPGPKAPGMKYTHYAPRAPLHLVDGSIDFLLSLALPVVRRGDVVGLLCTVESRPAIDSWLISESIPSDLVHLRTCGSRADLPSVARELYTVLRAFDETPVQVILSEIFPQDGVGQAIMNRLNKAAGGQIITQG